MSVADQGRRNDALGNGSNKTFYYEFKLFSAADLNVYVDGVLKAQGTDYDVDSIGDTGGSFTFRADIDAPADQSIVTSIGDNSYSQLTEYQDNEDVPPERIMKDLDKLIMLMQQIREKQGRSLLLAIESQLSNIQISDPDTVDKFLRVKSLGTPVHLDWATLASTGVVSLPLMAANGGTGIDAHLAGNGYMLIGNGAGFTLARITAGADIGLTFTAGGVQIANTYTPPTPAISQGMYGTRGNKSKNNATTPDTKFDLIADVVTCWNPADNSFIVKKAPGTLTIDFGAAGPVALGRDQVAAFDASKWLYPYWIMKEDGTISATVSLVAPPTGPTLPTDYVAFAPCNPVRWDGSSHIIKVYMDGPTTWYQARQSALTNGQSTVEAAVSLAALVPPAAGTIHLDTKYTNTGAASSTSTLRVITGVDFTVITSGGGDLIVSAPLTAPNISQQIIYINSSGAAVGLSLWAKGYTYPSGAM